MPWYTDSPMAAALGAAGSYLQSASDTKLKQQELKRQQELDRQAAAYNAAQLANQQQSEAFTESLYAPGKTRTITTQGTYTQAHPGHPKGSQKTMTRDETIPGTGGYYTQQQQIAAATAAALEDERRSVANLNKAKIPVQQALAYYWNTKPGIDEKRIYEQAQAHANTLKARLAGGKSSGLTQYQVLQLQRQVDAANAAAQEKYQAMVQHAQDHADSMNISASIAGQQPNYQPANIPAPQVIPYPVFPGSSGGVAPPAAAPQNQQQQISEAMSLIQNTPPSGRQAVFSALPYDLQLKLKAQGVNLQVSR
jgi:hypothetical protein